MKASMTAAMLLGAAGVACQTTSLTLRLMTYNIRWATPVAGPNEAYWSTRRPRLTAQLNYETAGRPESLLCMQEVVEQQLLDIAQDLGPAWAHVGVGRDDGAAAGEFSPIFYRPDTWDLVENRTYWLSETPDVPGSRGWDAALPRIATVASFRHAATGLPLVYMCTHFDHEGQTARERSAELLVRLAKGWESGSGPEDTAVPVFLGGDLNVEPDNAAYKTLVAEGNLRDASDVVPEAHRTGHSKTYTAFTDVDWDDMLIDHLFVRDPAARGIKFLSHAVLPNRFDDRLFISDHRPVVLDAQVSIEAAP
ncbi:endonuclease/Exonuclease/phosphatase [Colletotrichum graminicola]|uniref:Endonuclease/Exonuclease/phosphatase n=1 Tax=Colletotrichum graminicola (strain M1.001 / M2 / FGSC 10212) TaxID=645133 RepID=E3QUN8_COLGM|nr:endonuclease/Exonuclease/phosphatase [Colletotrichum graminicola M1.001]EFQ34576.1 endonuclease/Exonuclease/phosphatase [Colletotrichum graminicola M1.001]WDK22657.1 endonuclease/Exonuclease/phosphatase [Colletotrichum graminicola]